MPKRERSRAQITSDFKKAADLLPVRSKLYTNSDNIGRATKGSALGFLAKACLWRPLLEKGTEADYQTVIEALKKIIDSGEYQLNDNFMDNFTNNPNLKGNSAN